MGIRPAVVEQDRMVDLFLTLRRTSTLISIQDVPSTPPAVNRLPFLSPTPLFVVSCFLDLGPSNQDKRNSQSSINLISQIAKNNEPF